MLHLNKISYVDSSTVYITHNDLSNPITGDVRCTEVGKMVFDFITFDAGGHKLMTSFSANLTNGYFSLNPAMFPIANLAKGGAWLNLKDSNCKFVPIL